jgi:hypothetical protein
VGKVPVVAKSSDGSNAGCTVGVFFLIVVGIVAYYVFFAPDTETLANKYHIPAERIYVQPKPHGCAYNDAPLGDKHCDYKKHITVYSKDGLVIEKDGNRTGQCPSCAVWNVEETWEKVEE